MKPCPICKTEVKDSTNICWSCAYSFQEKKNIEPIKACPNCKAEIEENYDICWNCDYSFNDNKVIEFEQPEIPSYEKKINCLRCEIPMKKQGKFKFHEGDIFSLSVNRESFTLYLCPSCGKVEFFKPLK